MVPTQPSDTPYSRLKTSISRLSGRVLAAIDWIARQFHTSTERVSRYGIIAAVGIGMAMISAGEYIVSVIIWVVSAVVLSSKAIHWKGFVGHPRFTRLGKILYLLGAIGFLAISLYWTQVKRGDKPWTNLDINNDKPVVAKSEQQPAQTQQASPPQAKPEPIQQATQQPEKIQHKLKSIPPRKLPPLIKEWAVSTVIPFNKDGMSAGIPDELNSKDPLLMTYKTLASIGRMASRQSPVADNEAEAFTSDVLIYYILRSIVELQNKDTFYTLNSATGLTTATTSPVIVPDAKQFPEDQMDNFLIETKFGLHKDELLRVWKRYKFEMPADTIIDLYERGIGFKKEGYYELLFWFDPPLKHIGVLPINFVPPGNIDRRNIVSFAFTVSMRFKWYRDYAEAEPYKEWAQALFSGLQNRLKQPPP